MRLVLKAASVNVSGLVTTATVELVHRDQRVITKAVGQHTPQQLLVLSAEATVRGVTKFFPPGFGVLLHEIRPVPPEPAKTLCAVVLFLTPSQEQFLLGIAPLADDPSTAAAKAVLNAVNRRIELWLGEND